MWFCAEMYVFKKLIFHNALVQSNQPIFKLLLNTMNLDLVFHADLEKQKKSTSIFAFVPYKGCYFFFLKIFSSNMKNLVIATRNQIENPKLLHHLCAMFFANDAEFCVCLNLDPNLEFCFFFVALGKRHKITLYRSKALFPISHLHPNVHRRCV